MDDLNDSRQVLCERCRKFVSIADIKYISKGNESRMALCKSCLALFNVEADKKKQLSAATTARLNRPSYFCSRCRYKFKYDENSHATLRCPYCGKADKIVEDKLTSADAILKESSEF
jgi:protein-arginine kinase activator protein McsA